MYSVKNIINAITKEKRQERDGNIVLSAVLGAVSGTILALFAASKSDSINNPINKIKEKISKFKAL